MTALANQTAIHDLANLPPQVQQVLPVLAGLSLEQKMSLFHVLTQSNSHQEANELQNNTAQKDLAEKTPNEEAPSKVRKLSPLDRNYLGEVWMSDDFDEHLGDEFWLGHEDELV